MDDWMVVAGFISAIGLIVTIWYALLTVGSDDWNGYD